MSPLLLVALGLLFLTVSFLITNSTGRIAAVVVAAVMFLLAAVVETFGPLW